MIFSKDYCPFCKKTKDLFEANGVKKDEGYCAVEMDLMEGGGDLHTALKAHCGQNTVPVVFVGGDKIGGNDDTHAAKANGNLKAKLDAAGVANTF